MTQLIFGLDQNMDVLTFADNYDPTATIDDSSCVYQIALRSSHMQFIKMEPWLVQQHPTIIHLLA